MKSTRPINGRNPELPEAAYNVYMRTISEKTIHRIFFWSLLVKGFDSVVEIIGGFIFLFTGSLTDIIAYYVNNELKEDPTDLIARNIHHFLPYFSAHSQLFISWYLLSHGIVKIFLVVNLLRKKLWAYPVSIVALIIFILYQIYHLLFHGYSNLMLALTIFDILLIWLTWHEYQLLKKHLPVE
jgi:uncharacterized membrane protein